MEDDHGAADHPHRSVTLSQTWKIEREMLTATAQ